MSRLLLLAALLAGPLWADEAPPAPSVREKLRDRIKATLAPAPAKPEDGKKTEAEDVFVLEPIMVTESKGVRELGKLLASEERRKAEEAFAPAKGGTLYKNDRIELGVWWNPGAGWELLRIKW